MLGWDEAARSMGGVTLIKYLTGKLSFDNTIAILGTNHYYVYQGTFLYGPLHALSTAATYLLFGFSVQSARLPVAIFSALVILVTYAICRIMYKDGRIAIFAALFLVGSPMYFDFSTMVFSEIPITFAISLGTYLLFKVKRMYIDREYAKTNKIQGFYAIVSTVAGILFGFAGLTKPSAAFMIIPIVIYILYTGIDSKQYPAKKPRRKKQEKLNTGLRITKNQFFILSIPLLILGLSVISYWSYLKSIGFYQLYINFWLGGRGFHPTTEPFSLNVLLESWKPILAMFPVVVVLLLIAGLYNAIRRKPSSEEVFLLSWIGGYFLVLIASGAISPNYPLPMIPALAIFASLTIVKIIDLYKPLLISSKKNSGDETRKLDWKSGVAAVLIIFIVLQVIMVPVYKSISLQSGNEVRGEAYNPLIIRTFLQKHLPSLYWINTRYYNGSSIDFYARNGLDGVEIDTFRSLEVNIVRDIQQNNYKTATVIFLSELPNYFDYWFTIDDKYLTYRFVPLEPNLLSRYVAQDPAPKYLAMSEENEKKLIQNINKKESILKYSVYKIHIENSSLQLEEMNIDQVVRYK
jgi:hypothetical protein